MTPNCACNAPPLAEHPLVYLLEISFFLCLCLSQGRMGSTSRCLHTPVQARWCSSCPVLMPPSSHPSFGSWTPLSGPLLPPLRWVAPRLQGLSKMLRQKASIKQASVRHKSDANLHHTPVALLGARASVQQPGLLQQVQASAPLLAMHSLGPACTLFGRHALSLAAMHSLWPPCTLLGRHALSLVGLAGLEGAWEYPKRVFFLSLLAPAGLTRLGSGAGGGGSSSSGLGASELEGLGVSSYGLSVTTLEEVCGN